MTAPFAIAHLSDIHLAAGPRGAEPRRLFLWAVADLEARVTAGLVLAAIVLDGDLYDGASAPAERNLLAHGVQRLAHLAPVVVGRGNHDRPGDLDVLALLDAPYPITVYSEPGVHVLDDVVIPVVPWLDRVMPADDVRAYTVEQAAAREREALGAILDDLAAQAAYVANGRPVVFCGHLMLEGAVPGLGQPMKAGREFVLTLDDLARIPAVAYLLGHVHAPLAWRIGNAPVVYSNSLHRSAFGETDVKRYLLCTVEKGVATVAPIATPATPMVLLEDRWEAADALRPAGWCSMAWSNPPDVDGAEVRFRYTTPHAERAIAKEAATTVKRCLEDAGALRVKLDAVVQAPVRRRSPGFNAVATLDEKVLAYFAREQIDADAPRSRLARVYLAELERTLGTLRGGVATGGMRARRLSLTGIGPYRTPVTLDLDALPGELVAIMGENGTGKSTLLGCFPAAFAGKMPDGGLLSKRAKTPDALLEVDVLVGDATWQLQHHLARGTAFAVGPDGKPANKDGKLTTFRAWSAEHLLPTEVLLNTTVSPQGSAGLIGLDPGPRKGVFLRAIGCEHLEKLAKAARERRDAEKTTITTRDEQIAGEAKRRAALPPDPEGAVRDAREGHARAVAALQVAQDHATTRRAWEDAVGARRRAEGEQAAAAGALARLREQAAEHAGLLLAAGVIREAAERGRTIRVQLDELDGAEATGKAREGALVAQRLRLIADRTRALDEAIAATARAVAAREVLSGQGTTAARELDRQAAEEALVAAREVLAARSAEASNAALRDRIDAHRTAHEQVNATTLLADAHYIAALALEADAAAAADPHGGETRVASLAPAIEEARREVAERSGTLDRLRAEVAARRSAEARASEALAAAETIATRATAEADRLAGDLLGVDAEAATLASASLARIVARGALARDLDAVGPLAALAGPLDRAEAARDALAPSLAAAEGRVSASEQAAAALPPLPVEPAPATGQAVGTLALDAQRAAVDLALAESRVVQAGELDASIARLRQERADAVDARDAWDLLAAALGRNGVQAMEIDVAGPEVTRRINDLLHGCFGTRWTVLVDTQRENDDGDAVDGLPILVTDSEEDREDDAKTFSPGEQAILGRAISLALAGFVCARAGVEGVTLVLDETGAGVSAENIEPFAAMLRLAAREIGASKVLLVTHSPELGALCDATVRIGGGALEVLPR